MTFTLSVPIGSTDHLVGPAQARVSLVEYGDLECPNCKQAAPIVKLLLQKFPDELRFAFRHFPLEGVHPNAELAAEAAECAGAQGRFWQMHDLLFENQPHLQRDHLVAYAEKLQLDMARFKSELDGRVYQQRVREHVASGNESGVRSTPAFFIDGQIQDVSFGMNQLVAAVKARVQLKKPESTP
jgi:protein-disulfide isomerase